MGGREREREGGRVGESEGVGGREGGREVGEREGGREEGERVFLMFVMQHWATS